MSNNTKSHLDRLIRSYGRIKSRKLSDHKKFLYSDLLPKYEINCDQTSKIIDSLNNFKAVHLEIGFGFGDFLFATAKNNPDINFIACETHINGIVNLLAKLETEPLNNIRIFKSDVRLLLDKINSKIFSKIYILFPDPWPKPKHYKRRLINADFLQLLVDKMPQGAELVIATDHNEYRKSIIIDLITTNIFQWSAKSKADWQSFPPDWVKTKYQKKAENEGRNNVVFYSKKI